MQNVDDQDIRNAIIDVLTSGETAFGMKDYIRNLRIAQAESILEEQKRQAEALARAEQQKATEENADEGREPAEEPGSNNESEPISESKAEDKTSDMPFDAPLLTLRSLQRKTLPRILRKNVHPLSKGTE